VKGNILLYKNDLEFVLTLEVRIKKGTSNIKSQLETIDIKHDRIIFKIIK